ncbi:uncharacterized protein [Mytilus edulis]|uniref:uncharacterized protein n=1 Tax=Mytilus edulis TaxID=6550 RepID=UPI0039F1145D
MLKSWLTKETDQPPIHPILPDPREASMPEKAEVVVSANDSVDKTMTAASSKKRKRGEYNQSFDSEQKLKMAKYICEHGVSKAVRHFSTQTEKSINESTIRTLKTEYLLNCKLNRMVLIQKYLLKVKDVDRH